MTELRFISIPVAIVAAIIGLASCTSRAGSESGGKPVAAGLGLSGSNAMRLHGASRSIDALVSSALAAFESKDTTALREMMITPEEFNRSIYPELGMYYPAARDTSAQAREFVCANHMQGAGKALRKSLKELGGTHMELIAVRFREGAKRCSTYTLHEGTEVNVRLKDGGEAEMLALGAIVEMDGVYKLLSYRDRDD